MKDQQFKKLLGETIKYSFTKTGNEDPAGQLNGIYDSQSLSPWATWHGNLDAQVLLIGQDINERDYYLKNEGEEEDESPSNSKLRELFIEGGLEVGNPSERKEGSAATFTNAVLGIRNMDEDGRMNWHLDTAQLFIKPLIDIIEPGVIISMGKLAYEALAHIYSLSDIQFSEMAANNPIDLPGNKKLFVVYHCSGSGILKRDFELQKSDWSQIRSYLVKHYIMRQD